MVSPQAPQVPTTMSDSSYAFDAPDADVIIRAFLQQGSKGPTVRDFHLHKVILSVASTLFHDMFSIPQPPQPAEGDAALPIIRVTECAGVFETFLRLIYPIEPPVIDSLQLVDHLFRLADKYMAKGVHAKLKPILVSPSFLKDDPVWVYAIACRANLNKEAKLAIPHTFETDLINGVSRNKLRMMTTESYHRLLVEHSLRRDRLVNAVDEVYRSQQRWPNNCRCAGGQLKKEIRIQISDKPFLSRKMLEGFLSEHPSPPWCHSGCVLTSKESPSFLSDFMRRINEV